MNQPTVKILTQKGHHFLWIDDYLWMWDVPAEVEIQSDLAIQAFGDVLVAGYGLGVVQRQLLENSSARRVRTVTTVEKYQGVIDENQRVLGMIYGPVLIDDFYNLEPTRKYDCVVGDIWEEIIPKCLPTYLAFKTKALTLLRPGGKVLVWGQDYFEFLEGTP